MINAIPVVDLFSGPGGLAEGFSPCSTPLSLRQYKIVLSVEKEQYAYDTLLLRSFLRQFENGPPHEYYRYLNSSIAEPDWQRLYPEEWRAALRETEMLELGNPKAESRLDKRISEIKNEYGERTMVVGGPPCQAYSIAGRARIAGNSNYAPGKDPRIFLYKQYVEIVSRLRPMVAVMENVKGMISSSVEDVGVFQKIMSSLRNAAGKDSYRLHAFAPSKSDAAYDELPNNPSEFIVRAENYGIPQARHRVFIICIRSDVAEKLPAGYHPRLEIRSDGTTVESVIGAMPKLRSGLSRADGLRAWRKAVNKACDKVGRCLSAKGKYEKGEFTAALDRVRKSINKTTLERTGGGAPSPPESCSEDLRLWLHDRELKELPNNRTRGHMPADLERYVFAAVFAEIYGRSPKTDDFPAELAPNHKSWATKKFADRFRVQLREHPAKTITSHISKDGHYFIHPDPSQCRSLTVREAARLQTFPDNYLFRGNQTAQYVQVGNAVPPFLAHQIADCLWKVIRGYDRESQPQKRRGSSRAAIGREKHREVA